jgi:hypothetical protein
MVGGERGTSVQTVAAGGAVATATVTPELKHVAAAAGEVRACMTRGCRSPERPQGRLVFGLCWYTTGCGGGAGSVVQAGRRAIQL